MKGRFTTLCFPRDVSSPTSSPPQRELRSQATRPAAVFTVELEKGPMALHTWFQGKGTMLSAYYVYVTRN
jgi:hypothetical protein